MGMSGKQGKSVDGVHLRVESDRGHQNMRKRSQRQNLVILRIFRDMEAPKFGWAPCRICMAPDLEKFRGHEPKMGMSGKRGKSIDGVHLRVDSDRGPQNMRKRSQR